MKLTTTANCPMCGSVMEFTWETKDVPHFGDVMLIAGVCDCGFKHSDTIPLTQGEPSRYTLQISSIEDLDIRVIKSSSGTVRLPELGIDVEPGFSSEAYISNVEGVLIRIRDIVAFATSAAEKAGDLQRVQRGKEILESIDMAIEGQLTLTLVLEDPLGISEIVSDKVVCSILTEEETASLKTGTIMLDMES